MPFSRAKTTLGPSQRAALTDFMPSELEELVFGSRDYFRPPVKH